MDIQDIAQRAGMTESEVQNIYEQYLEVASRDGRIQDLDTESNIAALSTKHRVLPENEAEEIRQSRIKKKKGILANECDDGSRLMMDCLGCGWYDTTGFGQINAFCPECGYALYYECLPPKDVTEIEWSDNPDRLPN
jgi:hypothetical protein